ncbi:hypothetical protein [Spirosoma gilvum]
METSAKPLRGIDVIRQLLAVKRQAQQEAVENYRTDPEVRAIYERLTQKNKESRLGAK